MTASRALRFLAAKEVRHIVLRSPGMARSLHVRLDDPSEDALGVVRAAEGGSDSAAVRTALREAADRRRRAGALRAEVRALLADEQDAEEMRLVREQMAALAPDPDD